MPKAKGTTVANTRTNDPDRTRADILEAATREFSESGLSGARVDEIAERTKTSKRMIYYYFGSKEGLYREVLLSYYGKLRGAERELHLEDLEPLQALERLVEFTYEWHMTHAEDVRLVMVENIHRARNLTALPSIEPVNSSIIAAMTRILARGAEQGIIRPGIEAMDLYLSVAALCFFNVSNRYTIATIFGHDMASPKAWAARRATVTDLVLRSVVTDLAKLPAPGPKDVAAAG